MHQIFFSLSRLRLDVTADFLKERRRLAALPTTLRDLPRTKVVQRVRMRKEPGS